MRWCGLKENSIKLTEEGLLFQACFYAVSFFLAAIYLNEAWAYGMILMGFYLPFLQLKQKANRIQRQVVHTLPIFTTIIAAEADTGAAPVNAVMRAAQMPIPIGSLIRKELLALQQQNENIFTYQDVLGLHPGALRQRIQRWDAQDITELMSNIDSISKQGVDRSERLNDLAKTQNMNYQTHVDKAIKSLESKIQIPVGIFFILPLIISVFVPFLVGTSL
jgi:tight adherence protein C